MWTTKTGSRNGQFNINLVCWGDDASYTSPATCFYNSGTTVMQAPFWMDGYKNCFVLMKVSGINLGNDTVFIRNNGEEFHYQHHTRVVLW